MKLLKERLTGKPMSSGLVAYHDSVMLGMMGSTIVGRPRKVKFPISPLMQIGTQPLASTDSKRHVHIQTDTACFEK